MVAAQRFWRRVQYPSTVRGMGGSRVGSAIAHLATSLGEQTPRHGAVARWPGGHMLPGRSHLLRMWANIISHADGLVVDRFCNDRDRFGMKGANCRQNCRQSNRAVEGTLDRRLRTALEFEDSAIPVAPPAADGPAATSSSAR